MAFQRYIKGGKVKRPRVSISPLGHIRFGKGVIESFHLHRSSYVCLFFEQESHRIGIRGAESEYTEGVKKLTKTLGSMRISAKDFLDFFDIEHRVTTQYRLTYDETLTLYLIHLNTPLH